MHEAGKCCIELLEKTANALNDNVVSVMLFAVQKGNLELSVKLAVTKSVFSYILQNDPKQASILF